MRIVPGIGKQAGWAALVLAVSSFAAPACAATAPITAYFRDSALTGYNYPGPDRATIAIDVKASVGGTCGFATNGAPNAVFNFGEITPGFSATVPFTAECTAPWRIAVSSANGALKNAATVPAGYTNKAPYNVALNVASDGGPVTGSCPVAQIDQASGSTACTFEGTASTTNGLLIPRSFGLSGSAITMTAPAYAGSNILISGNYSDTLVVTVSPAV